MLCSSVSSPLSILLLALSASAQVVAVSRVVTPIGAGAVRSSGINSTGGEIPALALSAPGLTPALSAPAVSPGPPSAPSEPTAAFSRSDEKLIDTVQRKAFLYFLEQTDPKTGLTKDRTGNFGGGDRGIASMAATGFGLTALTIGESRGWIAREQAYARALTTLRHLRHAQAHEHGWFHHFVEAVDGKPLASSEISSIDTAFLLAGALTAGAYFPGTEVERLATEIYERVDFPWMMTDGGAKPDSLTLSMGWSERGGFLPSRWDAYSEHHILYMLGLGSPTHPLPAAAWRAWKRPENGPLTEASSSLFTHQYSQLWLDLRGRSDEGRDYFAKSIEATLAHRAVAIAAQGDYKTYGPNCWGFTACDGPLGYRSYGAAPSGLEHDGTIAPSAAGGSLAHTPELSLAALRHMKEAYGDRIWGRYGFSDAFNTDPRWKDRFNAEGLWRSPDAVGIDQGAILLAAENARTGGVWKSFMGTEPARRALGAAGLVAGPPSVELLLAAHRAKPKTAAGKKIPFAGIGGRDVYNPTAPFTTKFRGKKTTVMAARVEARDSEESVVVFFAKSSGRWRPLAGAPVFKLQDPFVMRADGELIFGGVETFPRASGGTGYRTVFYRGKTLSKLRIFAKGPDDMKDVRLAALAGGKFLLATRPQGAVGGRGKIGVSVIDGLASLGPEAIARAKLYDDLFAEGEWGGVNELHPMRNGLVGVLGHVAKIDGSGKRHYYPMAFAIDPATGRRTAMKILLERAQLPAGVSKLPGLEDVLFSGGLIRGADGTATLYVGAADAEVHRAVILDPFAEFETAASGGVLATPPFAP